MTTSRWTYSVCSGNLRVEAPGGYVEWQGKPAGRPVRKALALPGTDDCVALLGIVEGTHRYPDDLVRCRADGSIVWHAELPTDEPGDVYTEVWVNGGLRAATWYAYYVRLDRETGRALSREFVK